MMKRTVFFLALVAMWQSVFAYDFSAVAPSGQTLYYNIVNGEAHVVWPDANSEGYVSGSLTIPSSVQYNGITYSVTALAFTIIRVDGIPYGYGTFSGCSGLTSVTIPNSVTSIGKDAFIGCSGLMSVTIPNSVTSIGNYAFYGCSGLTSVTIPNSVTYIGDCVFCGCVGLTSPIYTNTHFAYLPGAYAGSYTIPSGITTICGGAFAGCSGLTSVTIPNSVTYIGEWAFYGCSALRTVNMLSPEPPVLGNDVFSGTHSSLVIMLNGCGYDAYCYYWNAYCNRLVETILDIDIHTETHDADRGTASVLPLRGHDVRCDSTAVITATPHYGYHFSHWSNGSTANPDTLYLTGDSTVTAYFAPNTYTVTARSGNDALGYASGSGEYLYRDTIELSATCTEPHYHFSHWNDGSTDNPRQYVVEGNSTLTAYFEIDVHTVRVTCDVARGTVSGGGRFTYGSACTVEAQAPYTGFVFHSWSNGVTANPYVFAVISDIELSAIFVAEGEEVYTVTVASADPEMGFVGGGGQALAGGRLTIRAQGYPGYRFLRWNDNNTDSVRTVTVTADRTYTAHFAQLVGIEEVSEGDELQVWVSDGCIHVRIGGREAVGGFEVYDVMGRLVAAVAAGRDACVPVPAGVYLMRVAGLPARKVVVMR